MSSRREQADPALAAGEPHLRKKHPCPECRMCQHCADIRCELCRGWLVRTVQPTQADGSRGA